MFGYRTVPAYLLACLRAVVFADELHECVVLLRKSDTTKISIRTHSQSMSRSHQSICSAFFIKSGEKYSRISSLVTQA
jgi:hypothetical protein